MARRFWIRSLLITAIGALGLFLLDMNLTGAIWESFYTPEATLTYFCETTLVGRFIRQPANTYTNLGYLLIGSLMIIYGLNDLRERRGNLIRRFPVYSFLYGAMVVYTFVGSSFFHASLGVLPEWIDLSAVYAVTAVPIIYNLHRISEAWGKRFSSWPFVACWLIWSVLSTVFTWQLKAHIVMPGMILLMLLTLGIAEGKRGSGLPWKWIFASLIATGLGICFFIADMNRIGCIPDGILHPHGLWHLAAAVGSASYYGYMRDEGKKG